MIVNSAGETLGYVDGCKTTNARGFTNGCVAYFGGSMGYVSFMSPIGGQTTGKLVPQSNGTMLLTK